MENTYNQVVLKLLVRLIDIIGLKDSYTNIHSRNVSKYASLLGIELGLPKDDVDILRIGGYLHDIGKIGIPDNILLKDSYLTDEEFEVMKRHVIIGESLVTIFNNQKLKEMIRSHHERLDGSGYPDGLKGGQIPYFARILSVVDTFDAMTTKRSYNDVKTLDEAFDELVRSSKKKINCGDEKVNQQLDPYIVSVFIHMVKNNTDLMDEFKKRDLELINNQKKKR